MKKLCVLFSILILFLAACNSDKTSNDNNDDKEPKQDEEVNDDNNDTKEDDETDNNPDNVQPTFTQADKLALVQQYYDYFGMRDYESAYELLSEKSKSMYSKEDFLLWNQLLEETGLYRYTISETADENVFTVDAVVNEYYWGDEIRESYERSVVVENGLIKLEVLDWDMDKNIGYGYDLLGLMYLDGVDKELDLAQAEEYFLLAIQYDPDNPYAYWDLGMALERSDQLEGALDNYNTALGMLPEDTPVDLAILLSNIGLIYEKLEDPDTARAYYEQALEVDPNNPDAAAGLEKLGQ
jgi:tetratricopeptide (TPR) repeat protein